jgi:hypothetical protein
MQSAQDFIKAKLEKLKKAKPISMKDIGREGSRNFIVEDATFLVSEEYKKKIYCFERLKILKHKGKVPRSVILEKAGVVYRISYYIVGKHGNKKDKWTWGQFCPVIMGRDLIKLLEQAKSEGILKSYL